MNVSWCLNSIYDYSHLRKLHKLIINNDADFVSTTEYS